MPSEEYPEQLRWQVYGERTLYDNRWVRLVQVDVVAADGNRRWHHVVGLNRVAAAVVVDDESRVVRWIPVADIPGLIGKGRILGSGSLVGLLTVLADWRSQIHDGTRSSNPEVIAPSIP